MRALKADGARLEELECLGQFEHVSEGGRDGLEGVPPAGANRDVIGMGVGGEGTPGNVPAGGPFDAAGGKDAVGVTVNEQGQQEVRRILRVAGALGIEGEGREGQALDGLDDEGDQIILGHPVSQVRGAGAARGGRSVFLKRWAMLP